MKIIDYILRLDYCAKQVMAKNTVGRDAANFDLDKFAKKVLKDFKKEAGKLLKIKKIKLDVDIWCDFDHIGNRIPHIEVTIKDYNIWLYNTGRNTFDYFEAKVKPADLYNLDIEEYVYAYITDELDTEREGLEIYRKDLQAQIDKVSSDIMKLEDKITSYTTEFAEDPDAPQCVENSDEQE